MSEEEEKTIEQIATEHCSPESQGCIIGLIVARNGDFSKALLLSLIRISLPTAYRLS
jgi:hypothetical protein